MKKKLKLFVLLIALVYPCSVIRSSSTLVLKLSDGKIETFNLQEKPVITMPGEKLKIITSFLETTYERKNVLKLYFDVGTDVDALAQDALFFTQMTDGKLVVTNIKENNRIIVSDLSGHLYSNCVVRNNNEATVCLESCPKGVYLIKIDNLKTIKIIKK